MHHDIEHKGRNLRLSEVNSTERAADAAAAGGWVLWFSSHALELMPIVQFLSLLAAIAASIAATIFYIRKGGK